MFCFDGVFGDAPSGGRGWGGESKVLEALWAITIDTSNPFLFANRNS